MVLGSSDIPARRTIVTFHDGMAWLAQLGMFFTLGLLVFPSRLDDVAVEGTVLALVAAAVARPLAVLVALPFGGYSVPDRLVLGWAGLRGAVPVVLATFPVIAGVEGGVDVFNIVFFAVVVSTVVQGATFEPFAHLLGATSDEQALPAPLVDSGAVRRLGAEVRQFAVRPGDAAAGRPVRDLGLPRDALLNLIVRGGEAIPPRGSTVIEPGDHLHVLVRQEAAVEFSRLLRRWREGPLAGRPRRPIGRRGVTVFATGPWTPGDGDPAAPSASAAWRSSSACGPGATSRARSSPSRTAGSPTPGPSRPRAPPASSRTPRGAGWPTPAGDAERSWWREVIGALEGERPGLGRGRGATSVRALDGRTGRDGHGRPGATRSGRMDRCEPQAGR